MDDSKLLDWLALNTDLSVISDGRGHWRVGVCRILRFEKKDKDTALPFYPEIDRTNNSLRYDISADISIRATEWSNNIRSAIKIAMKRRKYE
jgi:hypothetical protein